MLNKKLLITGGAGYIGSHAVLAALDQNYEVSVIDNLSTGFRSSIPKTCKFYEEDVANRPKVESILADFKPDAVIHFAGSIVVPESVSNPSKYYRNNMFASICLIDACIKNDINNFIFSSTAAVYGIPDTDTVTENSPKHPVNPYGHSKLMTEQMLVDTSSAHGFNYAALRYFNAAGADHQLRTGQSTPKATHLIKVACQVALGLYPCMKVFGTDYDTPDGTCIRDFIHVSDLAEAHLNVLDHMIKNNTSVIFNCGNGRGYSVKEVLDSVQRVSGLDLNIEFTHRRAGDPPCLIANATELKQKTNWQPRYNNIDDIIATAFEWERKIVR